MYTFGVIISKNMATASTNQAKNWRSLQVIFYALSAGLIILILAIKYLKSIGAVPHTEIDFPGYVFTAISAVMFLLSIPLFYRLVDNARKTADLDAKMNGYRAASLVQWALLEGAILIQVLHFYLMDADIAQKGITLLLILLFFRRPRKLQMIHELKLDDAEQRMFQEDTF
jgi:hypothetical protein